MRLIAFLLATVSFVITLASIVGTIGSFLPSPFHGAVCALLGLGLTVFWLVVAERH